ncbi:MAG TPA: hypothetical protein VH000_11555 [Rhizomicrobium sp.]|nr:hypothetical protein [Rhizomicrobium sp.]
MRHRPQIGVAMKHHLHSLLAALAMMAGTCAFAAPVPDSPADDTAVHDYVLTMDKVKAYEAADADLQAAARSSNALRGEIRQMAHEPDATSADLIAKFDKHPEIFAFYSKQGLSKADAALIPVTLLPACSAAQSPELAAGMSGLVAPQQVDFCKANMSELQSMPIFSTGQ